MIPLQIPPGIGPVLGPGNPGLMDRWQIIRAKSFWGEPAKMLYGH